MQDHFQAISCSLPAKLIPPESLTKLRTISDRLPFVSNFLLESRLGEDSRVDFSVPLLGFEKKLRVGLLDSEESTEVKFTDPYFMGNPVWQHYQAILNTYKQFYDSDPNTVFNGSKYAIAKYAPVRCFWLEFDVEDGGLDNPIPAIGIEVDDSSVEEDRFLRFWALDLLLNLGVDGNNLDLIESGLFLKKLTENLDKCRKSLPENARIIFIGANPSVRNDALRLIIDGIIPCEITKYLLEIGWGGLAKELDEIIGSLSGFVDNIILSFNVGNIIFPRIGLECYFIDPPHMGERWQLFVDYLVEAGLCSPEKGKALLSWTEMEGIGVFERFTACTKVVYQPHKPLEAKAYLGLWTNETYTE
jgi:hypothetical protein